MKKGRTRIRRRNNGYRKIILILALLFIIVQIFIRVIVPATVTFSRYVYKVARNFYFNSVAFYFNSDKLAEDDSAKFESDNWSGVDTYSVKINMDSKKNINEVTKENVNYNIKADYKVFDKNGKEYTEDLVDFVIAGVTEQEYNPDEGINKSISKESNLSDFDFSISLKPNVTLENGDYVFVTITTTSTKPYTKTLKGTFKIIIGKLGMSYQIEDEAYSPYLNVIITNTRNYYTVDTEFDGHKVGSTLGISEYLALTEEQKNNCHSMNIELNFNPEKVVLDTTSIEYLEAKNNNLIGYVNIKGDDGISTNEYVNNIKFKINAEESKVIKFYKKVAKNDNTYPATGVTTPIVTVISD